MGNLIGQSKKKLKRSNSWLFKRHSKVKARVERRLSQDSRKTESSVDSKEADVEAEYEHSANGDSEEKSPISKISGISPGKNGKRKTKINIQ